MRCQLARFLSTAAACLAALALNGVAVAQEADDPETEAPAGLPAVDAPDTVRSNLWLTQALMSEIVGVVAQALPEAPAAVLLAPGDKSSGTALFGTTAFVLLSERGYELFAPPAEADSSKTAADSTAAGDGSGVPAPAASPRPEVDAVLQYRILGVDLAYPRVGRTLGIWRRWVDRRVQVSALVEVTDAHTGRILLNRQLERTFADRLEAGDLAAVDSPLYDFTSATVGESGWHGRMEEIVVLGTLAGLVAVYFANTTN